MKNEDVFEELYKARKELLFLRGLIQEMIEALEYRANLSWVEQLIQKLEKYDDRIK